MHISQFPDKEQFCSFAKTHNVIPVVTEILADTDTPVTLLRKIHKNKKPVFLFESVEGGERWGRYSFIGASARSHIKIYSNEIEIRENGDPKNMPHHGDPFHILKEIMSNYRAPEITGLPRFWGGLVGYLTYEMVSFFEKIPNKWDDNKPLAHFIIPNTLLIFDNIRHTLFIVSIAFLEDIHGKHIKTDDAYNDALKNIQSVLAMMDQPGIEADNHPRSKNYALTAKYNEELYQTNVKKVKEHIFAGDIIQAVISQPFVSDSPPDLWSLYRAQRYINPSPYLYFMHFDNVALVGSSPETMVRLENGVATLRPIAGTLPRGKNEQEDREFASKLLGDEKERAEHLMLVDLGRNDLGRVAETGSVQVTDLMFVERYSHVMHIVSNITCDLRPECDAWDLLAATFPAGTLSGAPKIRAMEIIADLEQEPRGPYGGAVGYVSFNGNMDMAITIRTACIENGELIVRAGAGIVADSNPEREHQETVNKAMAIQKALQLLERSSNS